MENFLIAIIFYNTICWSCINNAYVDSVCAHTRIAQYIAHNFSSNTGEFYYYNSCCNFQKLDVLCMTISNIF